MISILLKALLKSILITLSVGVVFGVGCGIITQSWVNGVILFIVAIVGQYAINAIVSTISNNRNKEAEFLAQQVLKEAAERKLPYDLRCAYCSTLNRVGISFNSENTFICTECSQPNKVYLQFTTMRITTPLTQNGTSTFIDIPDEDTGVGQSTVNEPINMTEK